MSEEEKKTEETNTAEPANKDALSDTAKEPVESIEKTVEDLKKKIQEINEASEKEDTDKEDRKLNIPDFKLNEEQKEKITDIRQKTVETVNKSIDEIKSKAESFSKDPSVAKTVAYVKDNAFKAVDAAKTRINEIYTNPDVQTKLNDAGEKAKSFTETAYKAVSDKIPNDTKEKLNKDLTEAGKAVKTGAENLQTSVNDFIAKPEVQDAIEKTKAGAKDLAEKGSKAINDLFNKK